MSILQVENLSKHYGKNEQLVKALDEITFSVEKGEFVAIVGASGSGKSTLLHLIGGVDKPTSGKIIVDGVDITTLKEEELAKYRREKTSIIYQFYNLIPVLNIRENIEFPVLIDGKKVDEELPNGYGFVVLAFNFGEGKDNEMMYVSNANRQDIVKAMKEWIKKTEENFGNDTGKY